MVIHLIVAGELEDPNKWPSSWHTCYNIWKLSPYKIKIWNSNSIDQLLKSDDEEFFNILNKLPPIYKIDYVRYIILEKMGGAYFDMDIEIVDGSFLGKLKQDKFYFMEGTLGSYIENSIIIPSSIPTATQDVFYRIKSFVKHKIINNLKDCTQFNVIKYAGAYALSDWISRYISQMDVKYEILGQHQFSSTTNEIVYTRHHQSSEWNR